MQKQTQKAPTKTNQTENPQNASGTVIPHRLSPAVTLKSLLRIWSWQHWPQRNQECKPVSVAVKYALPVQKKNVIPGGGQLCGQRMGREEIKDRWKEKKGVI